MVSEQVSDFASRLIAGVGNQLKSITYYPHPFTNGGLVIVPKDDVEFVPDLMSQVYQQGPPPIMLYFLRMAELFQLSTTGVFGWTSPLEEKPHLAYWLKNKGEVLYGLDIRDEIELPDDTRHFLEIHLQRIKHCIRNWVLEQLSRKNYKAIVKEIERQVRYLMATALLSKEGEWNLSAEMVPNAFAESFEGGRPNAILADLLERTRRIGDLDETGARLSAFESVWLFEQFLIQIRECAR